MENKKLMEEVKEFVKETKPECWFDACWYLKDKHPGMEASAITKAVTNCVKDGTFSYMFH